MVAKKSEKFYFEGKKVKIGNSWFVLIPWKTAEYLEEKETYCFSVEGWK